MPSTNKLNQKGMSTTNAIAVVVTVIILCVIGFLVWWFGWHNASTASVNPVNTSGTSAASEQAAVKANWEKFFNGSTPTPERQQLLQNGQQYSQELAGYASSPLAKQASATVSSVKLNGNSATVTYTINVNGKPELPNQTGQAVLVNGQWKVSDTALCGLLELAGGQTPSVCASAKSSANSQGQMQGMSMPSSGTSSSSKSGQ